MRTAILFDLDDTLLDDRGAQDIYLASLYANHRDLLERSEADFRRSWRLAIDQHFQRYVRGEITLAEQRRARVRDAFGRPDLSDRKSDEIVAEFLGGYEAAWRLHPEAVEGLDRLRGTALGVVTNGNGEQQRKKLERTGILDRFETIVVSEEFGSAKPAAAIFHHACSRLSIDPAGCTFVGDDWKLDVEGARGAGLRPIWIDRSGGEVRRADANVPRIESLSELMEILARIDRPTPDAAAGPDRPPRS